jgi:hypothetical protein
MDSVLVEKIISAYKEQNDHGEQIVEKIRQIMFYQILDVFQSKLWPKKEKSKISD